MQLTREKGQRMWGGGGSSIAGGGGGGGTSLAGYATESWVDDNYLSKEFWNELFVVNGLEIIETKASGETEWAQVSSAAIVFTPNEIPSQEVSTDETTGTTTRTTRRITNIKVKTGLWTDSFLSALGLNSSGGGGGGGSLNEPLFGINNAGLSNHPSSSGQTIVWNGTAWVYGSVGSSTIEWSNITNKPTTIGDYGITDAYISSGTITLGANSITPWTDSNHPNSLSSYGITDAYTKSEVYTKTETDERFLTIAFFSRLFQAKNGSTNVNPNDTTSTIDNIKALFGFWTDQYLSALGQNSSGGGGGGGSLNEPLFGINNAGLSNHPSSSGQTIVWNGTAWVYGSVGSSTIAWSNITNKPTTLGEYGITDVYISSGTITLGSNSITPWTGTNHPTTLSDYGITDAVNISTTWWGQSIVNGTVTGNLSSVENITMSESIVGLKSLEFNTSGELQGYGGFLDFHYNGSLADFTSRIIEETSGVLSIQAGSLVNSEFVGAAAALVVGIGYNGSSITIGNGKLVWDETNNSLKVIRSNGSAANIYATGGVSALGMQAGVSVLDAMTFNYVTINNNLEFGAASRITHAVINDDRTFYIGNSDNSGWVALQDVCSQLGVSYWKIMANGEAFFAEKVQSPKFYLDGSRYLYLDGSNNLMFFNGSTAKQVAFVN